MPRAVTAENSTSGTCALESASIPASSSTWTGAAGSSSSTTTPHTGVIGRSASSAVHGPAARTLRPCSGAEPITSFAPARWALAAQACAAAAGGTGRPVSSRSALIPGASAGSSVRASSIHVGESPAYASDGPCPSSNSPTCSSGSSKPSSSR